MNADKEFLANILGSDDPDAPGTYGAMDPAVRGLARIHEKWGDAALAGFQAVPDLLFKHQKDLELSATDTVVLLNILMYWWYAKVKPFPRVTTIASRMDVTVRTVQRSISKLEELGLIKKEKNEKGSTVYDPDPLADKLSSLARKDKDFLIRTNGQKSGVAQTEEHAPF